MINNQSLCFQSIVVTIDMGNTIMSLDVFEANRDVIKNVILQKHWEGKPELRGPSWTTKSKDMCIPQNCDPDARKLWRLLPQLPLKPQSW